MWKKNILFITNTDGGIKLKSSLNFHLHMDNKFAVYFFLKKKIKQHDELLRLCHSYDNLKFWHIMIRNSELRKMGQIS